MTRSSRHKSSKHSSREAKDHSDSERDSIVKDRKVKEDSSVRVSKESEKRKVDLKESKYALSSGNGECAEEYSSSSKRRRHRASDDGVSDRWNGGDDERIGGSRKAKGSSESSKSKRREDSEDQRSKSEGKHRELGRKESREERKGKEGKSEKIVESEECNHAVNDKTDSNADDQLPSPESENQRERRVRRRRGSSDDGDKHEVDSGDVNDRQIDDVASEGKLKDEKHNRDKHREDVDRGNRHRDNKQRDARPARDHTNSRSDDKLTKDEKDASESRPKKPKLQESDRGRERDYDYDRDHSRERDFDLGRDRERDRDHDRDYDRSRDRDRNRDHDGDHEWDREQNRDRDRDRRDRHQDLDREWERERDRNRDRDVDHDREREVDRDGSHLGDRSLKYKDSRAKKRSPDERDDCIDAKSRGSKVHYSDMEIKLCGSRVESDADRGRSQPRQTYVDSSNRRRTSPCTSSHGGTDEYRHTKQEDLKYRDSMAEQRPKVSSKEVVGSSGASERSSKYRSMDRSFKMEDGHLGETIVERSLSSKASPMGLVERSPSSTSLDRRYTNRNGTRRSLDIEETGRRGSIGPRELSASEDRLSRELPLEKPLMDDSAQMDLLYYNRTNPSNSSSSLPPSSAFRAGIGSPSFMGSLEEDGRVNINGRYRRNGDPSIGRGQGNAWRGTPNWPSPLPNGFIHFQHGPPHGGYPAMISQFPSPSMFVRPPMELNHSGIPYHIHETDRFGGHLRPLGWQNMMDGSGPPHLHGWDGNNGSFRDEPHIFGGSDWDQNRHPMNGQGWETSSADMWKGENGDANMDLPSTLQKKDHPMPAPLEDELVGQEGPQAQLESSHGDLDNSIETGSIGSAKEIFKVSPTTDDDGIRNPSKGFSADNFAQRSRTYLSKLNISMELAGPDLYSQCMSLLGLDQTTAVDEDTAVIVNLKDGGKAVSRNSKILLCPPLFPAANDSVFQRAMDHYKKQRWQTSGLHYGGTFDITATSDVEKVEQGTTLCIVDKTEELVLACGTDMLDATIVTSDHNKPESDSQDVQETLEELVSSPCQVVQDQKHTPEPDLKEADEDSTPKSSEETVPAFSGNKVDEMTSEKVILKDVKSNHSPSFGNITEAANTSLTGGDMDELCRSEEMLVVADAIAGPLIFSEGSPKVSGALMPGSNESESVILSRIHHSPESTH